MKIWLGPAGSPESSTLKGIKRVKELELNAMEVEFVRGVHMGKELSEQCGKLARELGIKLSVHAPYYINLLSRSEKVKKDSVQRILISCERASELGAKYVVFHPGYYGTLPKKTACKIVKQAVVGMNEFIEQRKWKVKLAPETSGKLSQFGTLDEVLSLSLETGCSFCIDFAHIYARNLGKIDYEKIFDKIEKSEIKEIHSHFSNVSFGLKGERKHLVMDSSPPFEPLARVIMERGIDITIISESPVTWKDSLKMKKIFENVGYKF